MFTRHWANPVLLAIGHRTESPGCLVEQAVNAALGDAFRDAEALLIERLGNVSLADLAADFRTRYAAHRRGRKGHKHAVADAIVVGGSYAGMAAGLQLARARRRVLVIDAGQRRNRFAKASHGFLGQDGKPPELIASEARAQLLAYPTVHWRDATVEDAQGSINAFRVAAGGASHQGRRLILATGVVDELPEVPGLRERWGRSVFMYVPTAMATN